MGNRVNPPKQVVLPLEVQKNSQLKKAFDDAYYILFQLWKRTGAGLDLVDKNKNFSEAALVLIQPLLKLKGLVASNKKQIKKLNQTIVKFEPLLKLKGLIASNRKSIKSANQVIAALEPLLKLKGLVNSNKKEIKKINQLYVGD